METEHNPSASVALSVSRTDHTNNMSDRFAPESYEDFLCHGKTAQECTEIRRRLQEQEDENCEEESPSVGTELWNLFSATHRNPPETK